MLKSHDLYNLQKYNIEEGKLVEQLKCYKHGFPEIKIVSAATAPVYISIYGENECEYFRAIWNLNLDSNCSITKFVPASGAATRMFKDLYSFIGGEENKESKIFLDNIKTFAFYDQLNSKCKELYHKDIDTLISTSEVRPILDTLLSKEGLNYGNLPKGLLEFHRYNDFEIRTPFAEHLVEAALYAKCSNNVVNIHFTISPDYKTKFIEHCKALKESFENRYSIKYNVTFSTQSESSNIVTVNLDNSLYRDEQGNLVFRPGGHGALIENLNNIDSDIIFVKNIDNVCSESNISTTVEYKQLIGGILVDYQQTVFDYLQRLEDESQDIGLISDILSFIENRLHIRCNDFEEKSIKEKVDFCVSVLNRPIRVCGMVKNSGEPGGGPFCVIDENGITSMQILESVQISKKYAHELSNATHFNPVDIVCGVKNYKGDKFNLLDFVDDNAGFISEKSIAGKKVKALELPGLWNGAMSKWNTIFVEVPLITFNPVKTVNDLLRKEHR